MYYGDETEVGEGSGGGVSGVEEVGDHEVLIGCAGKV